MVFVVLYKLVQLFYNMKILESTVQYGKDSAKVFLQRSMCTENLPQLLPRIFHGTVAIWWIFEKSFIYNVICQFPVAS